MSQHSTTDRVTLTLFVEGGHVPLTFFIRTTDDLQKLLRSIEEAQLGEASAQWELETDQIQIAASVNGVSANDLESIINDAYQSLKAIDARDDAAIPRTVDDRGKRLTRSIVNRAKRTAQTVVVETLGQEPIYIEPTPLVQAEVPTRRRRREVITAWGSVDGELDVISVRRRAYFVIYEHGSTNQVRCIFPDDWMDTVKDLLGQRIVVEGKLRYRPNGTVSTLTEPTAINPLSEPQRSALQFRGALPGISGELSSADYIEQLRSG